MVLSNLASQLRCRVFQLMLSSSYRCDSRFAGTDAEMPTKSSTRIYLFMDRKHITVLAGYGIRLTDTENDVRRMNATHKMLRSTASIFSRNLTFALYP